MGQFIVIEGIDGSGKTTIIRELERLLKQRSKSVYKTREPTDGPIGALIRRLIFEGYDLSPKIYALLFAADRFWHNQFIIERYIDSFDYLISDRYIYSSIAYQTASSELTEDFIYRINKGIRMPDKAFYIDIEPSKALRRIKRKKNIFEKRRFLEIVRRNYLSLVERGNLIKIDGSQSPKEIAKVIYAHLTG